MSWSQRFDRLARRAGRAAGTWQTMLAVYLIATGWELGAWLLGIEHPVLRFQIDVLSFVLPMTALVLLTNSSNRDTEALQLKDDEVIRAVDGARDEVAGLEERDAEEIERLKAECGSDAR